MSEKPRKKHFGDKIAERMAREQNPVRPEEEPETEQRRSISDFHRQLEKRVKDSEGGD